AVLGTVITAAGGNVANTGVFTIGSATYTINGVEKTMDVAPYISNSRTYMPIRYVAYALGIDDNNILWDGAKRTVTLIKGDKVVQMTIGSTTLLINGAAVTMDVAPEISSDRTMLPAAFVAQAFGSAATWDATTQTVSIK
ncbi:MAG: copper amine oxidase N-terminal domain-containing protein, partial [Syntrophomonadaceae bacterium]|nr:copper amine oxidase N-terminal domain-containing protein [Syntrophomonadaceae bacterium]